MKRFVPIAFIFICYLSTLTLYAQIPDTTYYFYDSSWINCPKENAVFYRKAFVNNKHWQVEDWYIKENKLQMTGTYKDKKQEIKHGLFTYYSSNGVITNITNYKNDKYDGNNEYFDSLGRKVLTSTYSKGELINEQYYFEDGSPCIGPNCFSKPEFPGGNKGMDSYIYYNVELHDSLSRNSIGGIVTMEFTIDTIGRIINVKVVKSDDEILNETACEIIREMPRWNPGYYLNKPKEMKIKMNINFKI